MNRICVRCSIHVYLHYIITDFYFFITCVLVSIFISINPVTTHYFKFHSLTSRRPNCHVEVTLVTLVLTGSPSWLPGNRTLTFTMANYLSYVKAVLLFNTACCSFMVPKIKFFRRPSTDLIPSFFVWEQNSCNLKYFILLSLRQIDDFYGHSSCETRWVTFPVLYYYHLCYKHWLTVVCPTLCTANSKQWTEIAGCHDKHCFDCPWGYSTYWSDWRRAGNHGLRCISSAFMK
jgi:hypothetical protein